MERGQSPTVPAPGGAGRIGGGGWTRLPAAARRAVLTAVVAGATVGGVGCLSVGKAARSMKEAVGLAAAKPATVLTVAFQPQIQYLPDPTQDEVRRPGIVGQLFLTAADGQFTDVDGDLTVMATDISPRPSGQPPALREIWHFDKATLRRLKTKDERFGETYALFLPYPPNWKDVTHITLDAQYVPKPDHGPAGPQLSCSPQPITLDFTPPGNKPVWTEVGKAGGRPTTAPLEMKGMPNLDKAIAQGRVGAPLAGPQSGMTATQQAAAATTAPLPPVMNMSNNPYTAAPGANGSTVHTTAYALPPGQTLPPGWTVGPNREMVPPGWTVGPNNNLVAPNGTNPWTAPPPGVANAGAVPPTAPTGYAAPAAAPTGYRPPAAIPMPPPNFTPTTPANMPGAMPTAAMAAPTGALPPSSATYPMIPTPSAETAPLPAIPPGPAAGNATAAGFDPNSTVGPWANSPTAPGGYPPMTLPVPPTGGETRVISRR